MLVLFVAVFTAVFLSAMCSLFEAVLYSVPVAHVEKMAQTRRSGRVLKKLRADIDRPISAILSLNTVANTAGAAVAGAAAASVFGASNLPLFTAVFTLIILFLSEILPKTAGVVYSRNLAGPIAYPLSALVVIFAPFIWLSGLATKLVTRGKKEAGISDDELIVMARLGLKEGTIDADEMDVIQNILHLERKMARDVMTPRTMMVAVDGNATIAAARERPEILTHGRLPVFERNSDDIVGVVFRRDLLVKQEASDTRPVRELMKPVRFIADEDKLNKLLPLFLESRQHLFVVLDEHGSVAGLITLEDVLEEILGKEIVDEFDNEIDMRALARERRDTLLSQSHWSHTPKGDSDE